MEDNQQPIEKKKREKKEKPRWKVAKQIPSETRVKQWHIKIDKDNYVVAVAFKPRFGDQTTIFNGTKTGRISDWKPLHVLNGEQPVEATQWLLAHLNIDGVVTHSDIYEARMPVKK